MPSTSDHVSSSTPFHTSQEPRTFDQEMEVTVRKREGDGPSDYGTFVSWGSEFTVLEPPGLMGQQTHLHGAAGMFPVSRRRRGRGGGIRGRSAAGEVVVDMGPEDAAPWHVTQLKAPGPERYQLMFLMYEKEGVFVPGDRSIVVLNRVPNHFLVVN